MSNWIDEPDLSPDELRDAGAAFIIFRPGYYEEEQARLVASGVLPAGGR